MTPTPPRMPQFLGLSVVALSVVVSPLAAWAQDANVVVLDTVVVDGASSNAGTGFGFVALDAASATRTDTPLRDVPQSVQVVTRELIASQNATTISDAVLNASAVVPSNTRAGQAEVFNIRGFQVERYAVNGFVLNPLSQRPTVLRDTVNVARVEVLKGPASVLYGRGDPGGLINIVTLLPEYEKSLDVTAEGGGYGFARLAGTATGALNAGRTLAGRLSIAAEREDGWRSEVFPSSERFYVAPSLLWEPDERTQLVLDAEYSRQDVPFDRGVIAFGESVLAPYSLELGESFSRQKDDYASATWRFRHEVNDWLTVRQNGRYDHGFNDRFSVDPRSVNAAGTLVSRRSIKAEETFSSLDLQFEALARFDTGAIGHETLLGYEYNQADQRLPSSEATLASLDLRTLVYGAVPGRFRERSDLDAEATLHSVYLQDQIALGERWKLLAGARLDHVEQEQTDIGTASALEDTAVTPRIGLVYQPVPDVSLFANYAQSFKPQTGLDRLGAGFDPQEGHQVEAGVKIDLVPGRLAATASVFQITRENVLTEDPLDADFSVMTGEQRSRGVEFDLSGEILPGWNLLASAAYVDAEVTEDNAVPVGNRLEGVPRLSSRLWTTYEVQSGRLEGLGFGGGVLAIGDRKGDLANSFEVDGFARLDATVYYDFNEATRLSVNAENLTDEDYIYAVSGRTEVIPGDPFNVVARLRTRF